MTTMPTSTSIESAANRTKADAEEYPVLFLLNALGVGGSERKTVAAVNELHRTGWGVHLAYLDARTALLDSVSSGIPVLFLARKGKLSFSAIRKLRTYIRREGISKIVCVNLYPLLYAQAASGLLPARQRPTIVLMVNTTEHARRKERRQMLLYRVLMRRAQRVIFGCRAQRQLWIRRFGLDERKCGVIYNGIDDQRFAPGAVNVGPTVAELPPRY